jgi:tyrosyl-tRNA synthetase
MSNKDKIDELLSRGVGEFIDPGGIFRSKLETNPEKIVIKFGIDPTRPDLHIGHAVILRKLRQFQDLGCKIILLIGDFTGLIGDPTGRSKVRPEISSREIVENMLSYTKPLSKILKIEPTNKTEESAHIIRDGSGLIIDTPWYGWMRNSDWFYNVTDIEVDSVPGENVEVQYEGQPKAVFPKNTFPAKAAIFENDRLQKKIGRPVKTTSLVNFLSVLRNVSLSQLSERDMFQERMKKGEPLFMHEMMYPVAQGIDSDVLSDIYGSCDLEVGGTDQTFNMLMGRRVMEMTKKPKEKIQSVLAFKILEGLDGKEKMSKSLDNYVSITDEPSGMYGKIMSIPDTSIANYFELCTEMPIKEVEKIREAVSKGTTNPFEEKKKLAKEIVRIYHSEDKAKEAEENFIKTFSKKEIPDSVEEVEKKGRPIDMLVAIGATASTSVSRRYFEDGSVLDMTDNKKMTLKDDFIEGHTYKIGKHTFIKIK